MRVMWTYNGLFNLTRFTRNPSFRIGFFWSSSIVSQLFYLNSGLEAWFISHLAAASSGTHPASTELSEHRNAGKTPWHQVKYVYMIPSFHKGLLYLTYKGKFRLSRHMQSISESSLRKIRDSNEYRRLHADNNRHINILVRRKRFTCFTKITISLIILFTWSLLKSGLVGIQINVLPSLIISNHWCACKRTPFLCISIAL